MSCGWKLAAPSSNGPPPKGAVHSTQMSCGWKPMNDQPKIETIATRCSLDADVVRMETPTLSHDTVLVAVAVHSTQMSCGWKRDQTVIIPGFSALFTRRRCR